MAPGESGIHPWITCPYEGACRARRAPREFPRRGTFRLSGQLGPRVRGGMLMLPSHATAPRATRPGRGPRPRGHAELANSRNHLAEDHHHPHRGDQDQHDPHEAGPGLRRRRRLEIRAAGIEPVTRNRALRRARRAKARTLVHISLQTMVRAVGRSLVNRVRYLPPCLIPDDPFARPPCPRRSCSA